MKLKMLLIHKKCSKVIMQVFGILIEHRDVIIDLCNINYRYDIASRLYSMSRCKIFAFDYR